MGGVEETQLSSAKSPNETKARQHFRFKDKKITQKEQAILGQVKSQRQQGVHEQT